MPSEPKSQPLRPPKSSYRGKNGFIDPTRARMNSAAATGAGDSSRNLHAIAADLANASEQEKRELGDAVDRHAFMERALELKGSYFPSLIEMQRSNEQPETSEFIAQRRAELKKAHEAQIAKLFALHAQEYRQDALERYVAKDDLVNITEIKGFHKMAHHPQNHLTISMDDELDSYKESYLQTDLELLKRQKKLQSEEDQALRQRNAQFPPSVAAYRAIRSKDTQIRIARFLSEQSRSAKERMISEFGWAWRQTAALQDAYDKDPEFNDEVQEALRGIEARDPRRRPS